MKTFALLVQIVAAVIKLFTKRADTERKRRQREDVLKVLEIERTEYSRDELVERLRKPPEQE